MTNKSSQYGHTALKKLFYFPVTKLDYLNTPLLILGV